MGEKDNLYKKLRQQYTDEELVEFFVFPHGLTKEEKNKADRELWEFRKKRLQEMTLEEKIYSGLLGIKYQIKAYVESGYYDENKNVSNYLHEYMRVVAKNQKELAEDIAIHATRLSRILNRREKLSLAIAYRLEGHSGDLLPAILWWKLMQKEVEHEIRTDEKERRKEKKRVKNIAYKNAS